MIQWFLGTDLALDDEGEIDVVDGDWAEMEGTTCLQQNLLDRLATSPGGLLWHPEFGAGVQELVGRCLNQDDFDEIEAMVRLALLEDPRVKEVLELDVVRKVSAMPEAWDFQPFKERPWGGGGIEEPEVTVLATVRTQDGQVVGNLVFPFDTGSAL